MVYSPEEGDHIEEQTTDSIAVSRPLPGVIAVLSALREQGHNLALVTSRKEGFQYSPYVERLGKYFDVMMGLSQDVPDKALAFQKVMQQTGFTADTTVAIGDAQGDYEAAVAAGPMLGFIAAQYYVNHSFYEREANVSESESRPVGSPYFFASVGDVLQIPGLVRDFTENYQSSLAASQGRTM